MFIVGRTRRVNQAKARAAIAAAVEAGVRASDITGLPIFVWSSIFSADPPAVTWSARVEHLADVEAANAALIADEGWLTLVDRAGHAFAPGASSMMLRHIG